MQPVIKALLILTCLSCRPQQAHSQLPAGLTSAIFGPNSLLRGVKNVLGGVLALDGVHSKCVQKSICNEFSNEIVETTAKIDPVKRTLVYVPKIVKRRGRLRWMGDLVVNGLSKMGTKLGLLSSNRRQANLGLLGPVVSFASSEFGKIPLQSILQ